MSGPLVASGISHAAATALFGPDTIFVPSTGVAATDTAALVAAHAALPAGGGTIRLDSGPYLVTADQVNFTKAVHLIGSGPSGVSVASGSSFLHPGSTINCASATGVAITVNSDGCSFEKLALFNTAGATPTAGAGIQIKTLGKSTRVIDCSFNGFWVNLQFIQGYEWYVDRCHFFDPVQYGIRVQDTDIADAGDGIISNCFVYSGPTHLAPVAGIQWESGGGLKVLGTKVNSRGVAKFAVGMNFQVADGITTSVAVISGCSVENASYGIVFQLAAGGTGQFHLISITGNEVYALDNQCISIVSSVVGKLGGAVIIGNVGYSANGLKNKLIYLQNVDNIVIGANCPMYGATLLDKGVGVTNATLYGVAV